MIKTRWDSTDSYCDYINVKYHCQNEKTYTVKKNTNFTKTLLYFSKKEKKAMSNLFSYQVIFLVIPSYQHTDISTGLCPVLNLYKY